MNIDPKDIFKVSAKKGIGVPDLLNSIAKLIPPPAD